MNPDSPIDPRSALEFSLTALLLGELPHEQAAALHQKLAQDAELAALYERLKHTINLVRETVSSPAEQIAEQPAPLKLSEARRQKLLQHFKAIPESGGSGQPVPSQPQRRPGPAFFRREFPRPRGRARRLLVPAGIAAALLAVAGALLLPEVMRRVDERHTLGGEESEEKRELSSQSYWSSRPASSVPRPPTEAFTKRADRAGGAALSASEPVPAPAQPAGTPIVLPKGGAPDAASSAFLSRNAWTPQSAPATKSRSIFDDAATLGRSVGAGATAAGFKLNPANSGSAVQARPPEVAASDSFFSQPEAVGALEAGKMVKNEGQIQALGEPSPSVTLAPHYASLAGTEDTDIAARAVPTTPPATPETTFAYRLNQTVQRAARGTAVPSSPELPPPPNAGLPAEGVPPQEAWTAGTANGALPPPALTPSAGAPPNRLEVPSVPLETHSEVLAGVVAGSQATTPSSQSASVDSLTAAGTALETRRAQMTIEDMMRDTGRLQTRPSTDSRKGAELLREADVTEARKGELSRAQETAVNEAVYRQDELLTSGLRQKQGNVSLSVRGGTAPAQTGQPSTVPSGELGQPSVVAAKAKSAEPTTDDRKALGFDWYLGNVLAKPGQIMAQGGTAPPNAGHPRPAGETHGTPDVELAWSDASKRGHDTTAVAGNVLPITAGSGSSDLSYALNFDTRPLPGLSGSDGIQAPVLGDAPVAGQFYRLKGDEVGGGGRVKAEEKVNSVELADKADQEGQKRTSESERDDQRVASNVYSLNVVGYYNLPATATNVVTVAPVQSGTYDRYTATRLLSQAGEENKDAHGAQRPPIVLPSSEPETKFALKDTSGVEQKSRQYFEAKRNLDELQRFRQILDMKIASEGIETDLPKTVMVEIVDKAAAQPTQTPSLGERIRGAFGGKVERSARIKVERDQSDISGLAERGQTQGYDPYFVQSEFERMQSEAVLGKVIDDLDLRKAWANKQGGGTLTREEALGRLKKSLDLRPVPNTSLIDVGVKGDSSEEAARIANAVAEAYRDQRREQRKELSAGGIKALEERHGAQEQKVREAQANVDRLRKELNIADAVAGGRGPSPLMTADTPGKLEAQRIENHEQLALQQTLLNQLQEVKKTSGSQALAQVLPAATGDALLSSLLEQSAIAQQRLSALQKEYGPDHPEVLKTKASAEDLHTKIAKRADAVMAALEARTTAVQKSLNDLEQEVAQATSNDTVTVAQGRPSVEAKHKLEELQAVRKAAQTNQPDVAPPKPVAPAPVPQPEVQTSDNAFSTFSLNVSDVSFKLAAASLEKGEMPEPATMRSEEFINAFNYRDPEPPPGVAVGFAWERAQYPFAQNRDLLRFSIKTAAQGREPGRRMNVVLLLDTSGSMERADRVQIIREALRVLAGQLQPQDKFSVVTFARTARLWVDGVPGNQAAQVVEEVSGITPQGGTNLEDALNLAYQTALRHYLAGGINRVVLLTDGAANLGNVEPEALKQKVEANRKQGIALDCFGIGWEGYNDDVLEVLSRNGDGRYGFINTPEEAATEFAGQLAGALHVAASDVKAQVEFNPARVTAYRQIGYAKHQLTKEQFRDNTVAAAQIGAAESGNALYVIAANPAGSGPLATVRVRYRVPGTSEVHEHEWSVPYTRNALPLDQSSPAMRLAATASAFSEWLASSPYAAEVTPDRLLGYLSGVPEVYGADTRPKKLEWMLRQAKSTAGK